MNHPREKGLLRLLRSSPFCFAEEFRQQGREERASFDLSFFKMVTWLSDALLSVFNGFGWTIADAGHTVCTGVAPGGFTVLQVNVIHRAPGFASSTADTAFLRPKGVGFYKKTIEHRIDRAAHQTVIEIVSRCGKGAVCFYVSYNIGNMRLCLLNDPSGFIGGRGVKHGDIVFRHDH